MKQLKLHRHIPVLRRLYLQRDHARLERDCASADREQARFERDRAIADRDQLRLERDRALVTEAISPPLAEHPVQAGNPFAPEYQSDVYRSRNPDLQLLNEQQLLEHAITHGWHEGRIMS
jgi:hypothetical protein